MTQDTFTYDVFLSHSSKDKATVGALAERLRADGLRVWLDEWIIQPGDVIGLQMEQGLEQSRTLILCMSENAFGSDWVTLERHTVMFRDPLNTARRFIPLRLDDYKGPDILAQYLYLDWQTPDDAAYARLLDTCHPPPPTDQNALAATNDAPHTTHATADAPATTETVAVAASPKPAPNLILPARSRPSLGAHHSRGPHRKSLGRGGDVGRSARDLGV